MSGIHLIEGVFWWCVAVAPFVRIGILIVGIVRDGRVRSDR